MPPRAHALIRTCTHTQNQLDKTCVYLAVVLIVSSGLFSLCLQDGYILLLSLCEEVNSRADVVNKHCARLTFVGKCWSLQSLYRV